MPYWQLQGIVSFNRNLNNKTLGFITGDMKLITMPFFHRNTLFFEGLDKRADILATKNTDEYFFALDKSSHINCWCNFSGKLISRKFVDHTMYGDYEIDRQVWDKQWFSFSLIYKKNMDLRSSSSVITPGMP